MHAFDIQPFIVTLAGMFLARGLCYHDRDRFDPDRGRHVHGVRADQDRPVRRPWISAERDHRGFWSWWWRRTC
ncbi:hypothetical protein [Nonomuraea rubra]|uniref:hypothetical protein n=1 Tax=Nonomuraea rubra TaxID=46180 RepID=UPI0031E82DF5